MISPLIDDATLPDGSDNPCESYLKRLKNGPSRRSMEASLRRILAILQEEKNGSAVFAKPPRLDPVEAAWWLLKPEDVKHIRGLIESPDRDYSVATVNRYMAALRGVLQECQESRLMSAEDYLAALRILRTKPLPADQH